MTIMTFGSTQSGESGLEFADDPEDAETIHVDILVGSDHYWDLVRNNGPVAIETKLGWVLTFAAHHL